MRWPSRNIFYSFFFFCLGWGSSLKHYQSLRSPQSLEMKSGSRTCLWDWLVRSKGEHTNAIANAHARTRSREAGPDQDNKQRHRASCPAAARTTPHRTGPRPMPCAVPRIDAPAPPVRIRSTILFWPAARARVLTCQFKDARLLGSTASPVSVRDGRSGSAAGSRDPGWWGSHGHSPIPAPPREGLLRTPNKAWPTEVLKSKESALGGGSRVKGPAPRVPFPSARLSRLLAGPVGSRCAVLLRCAAGSSLFWPARRCGRRPIRLLRGVLCGCTNN